MYGFWYDHVKAKYCEKGKLCYMDTDSFIVYITDSFIGYIKADDIYKEIAKDVETRFYTLNYELDRPLLKIKNEKGNWTNER